MLGRVRKAVAKWALKPLLRGKAWSDLEFEHYFVNVAGRAQAPWVAQTTATREELQSRHAVVNSCVRRIQTAFVEGVLEYGVTQPDGTFRVAKVTPAAPPLALLQHPNPDFDQDRLFNYNISHLLSTGVFYVWVWRNRGKLPAELWPIPTSWVTPVLADNMGDENSRLYKGFAIRVPTGKVYPVAPADMLYAGFGDPHNLTGFAGPIQAAERDVQTDTERENYIMEMLTNLKVPGLVLKQEESWTNEQKADLRAALGDLIGKGKRGEPLLISGKNAEANIVAPLKDLDWPGLSSLSETRICAALGVPPTLIGLRSGLETTGLSGQDVQSAERIFYRGTMKALWRAMAAMLNQPYLRLWGLQGTPAAFRFNLDDVGALQYDWAMNSEATERAGRTGCVYVNEVRKWLGLPPDPQRDGVYLLPVGLQEMKDGAPLMVVPGPTEHLGSEEEDVAEPTEPVEDETPAEGSESEAL